MITRNNIQPDSSSFGKWMLFLLFVLSINVGLFAQNFSDRARFKMNQAGVWSIGAGIGTPVVHGDILPKFGESFTAFAVRDLNRWFSFRNEITAGTAEGRNWYMNSGYHLNPAWNGKHNSRADYTTSQSSSVVYYNFKMNFVSVDVGLEVKALNVAEHWFDMDNPPRWDVNLSVGGGALFFQTNVNALNKFGERYKFFTRSGEEYITPSDQDKKSAMKKTLDNQMDRTYETPAKSGSFNFAISKGDKDEHYTTNATNTNVTGTMALSAGLTVQYEVARGLKTGLRINHHMTFNDLLDGHDLNDRYRYTFNDNLSNTSVLISYAL